MQYLIVIIVGLAVIWGVFLLSSRKKPEVTPEVNSVIEEKEKSVEVQRSLDSLYAEEKGAWLCSRCETINAKGTSVCAACGTSRV